ARRCRFQTRVPLRSSCCSNSPAVVTSVFSSKRKGPTTPCTSARSTVVAERLTTPRRCLSSRRLAPFLSKLTLRLADLEVVSKLDRGEDSIRPPGGLRPSRAGALGELGASAVPRSPEHAR